MKVFSRVNLLSLDICGIFPTHKVICGKKMCTDI